MLQAEALLFTLALALARGLCERRGLLRRHVDALPVEHIGGGDDLDARVVAAPALAVVRAGAY